MPDKIINATRIIVVALTDAGKNVLLKQMTDERTLRLKYIHTPRWRIPFKIRSYLKTVSVFLPKDAPERHEVLGFRRMSSYDKSQFALGVRHSFEDEGCSHEDFEVSFLDE